MYHTVTIYYKGAMEKRILVPITPSNVSNKVIRKADQWGQRTGANLRFLHVRSIIRPVDVNFSYGAISIEEDSGELDKYLNTLDIKSAYSVAVRTGVIYTQIIEEEKRFKADLIIMAAHSHTAFARFFLGSNTDYTIHHSTCPVFVFKATMQPENNRIIVPLDYSEVNQSVISIADAWASQSQSRLHFVHVVAPPEDAHYSGNYVWGREYAEEIHERRRSDRINRISSKQHEKMANYLDSMKLHAAYDCTIKFGKPYLEILHLQRSLNANLIMMATHSHTLLNRIFVGSNTDYILHHSNCSMYIYKE